MMLNGALETPRIRLALLLWLTGMIGAVVITVSIVPELLHQHTVPVPLWLVTAASLAQSAVLVGLAVWAGVAMSPTVGLHAPVFEAAVTSRPVLPALKPQALAGLIAGAFAGALLLAFSRYSPAAIAVVQDRFNPPLLGRFFMAASQRSCFCAGA